MILYLDSIPQTVNISDQSGWANPAAEVRYGFFDWLYNRPYPGSYIYIDLQNTPSFIRNMFPHITACSMYSDQELNKILNIVALAHELAHAYDAAKDIKVFYWKSSATREGYAQRFYEEPMFHYYRMPGRYEKLP